ncbi:SusC/RagA family TonB-linked outer membrane protein [Lutibacter sp.]|uniref:SusC/RagA family TonB-linked outer membrane protein n=1 Tax=Lutibacter sp. TaxID=1925666 RepID=UPI0027356E52|nr:SusC/RagA family TonB-linked outer membrane protein [Lutibacter sp.]MDP3311840.1 SusC/RagA family TonB-linked outer membrane protein [Lutibacter sp.]
MKTKFNGFLTLLLAFMVQITFAQEKTVTGKVSDVNGSLPGVTVLIKGTKTGTQTDFDGNYSIKATSGAVLQFSFVGMKTVDKTVGAANTINVTMQEDAQALDEVVVTAFGIKKEKKALGYAVSTISSDAIGSKPEQDVARALVGKAPGVDITQTSGVSGSGTNIIIRGYTSITGSNQPLFVVDGIPFNTDTNSDRGFTGGNTTASSRFLDIDPSSIKEISILKGLSATVLYGDRGRNGVVLITTKSGDAGNINKKMEISVTQSLFFNEANLPEYQNSYGNGFQNSYSAAFSNWGPHFDTRGTAGVAADGTIPHPYSNAINNAAFPEYIGARIPYQAFSGIEDFFRVGKVISNSVGISGRGDKVAYNFNYGHTDDEGFTPGNNYRRNAFSLGGQAELANNFTISSTFNFTGVDKTAPASAAGFGSNPTAGTASLFANILYTPRNLDLMNLPFENPVTGANVYYRGGGDMQNPRWTVKNTADLEIVNRFFTNTALNYKLNDWMNVNYSVGFDTYTQKQRYQINRGGPQVPDGVLATSYRINTTWDHTVSLNFNKTLSDNLNLEGVFGVNANRETRDFTSTSSTNQFTFGLFTHQNFVDHTASSSKYEVNKLGAYSSLTLAYNNYMFLNLQGRNDWASTLEKNNNSLFYPSVSLSVIPTDMIEGLKSDKINYMKFRVGYGTSAGFPDAYQTRVGLGTGTNSFINPINGNVMNVHSVSNQVGNLDLKPELIEEIEVGFEGKFFSSRVSVDISLYDKTSSDLIIDRNLDPSTGFTFTTQNVASINSRGIEIGLNLVPVKFGDFTWNLNGNFSINENIVKSLAEGVEKIPIAGFTNLGNFAEPGQPYGIMYGSTVARDANGNKIVASTGSYLAATEIGVIGNPNPDYKLNGSTSLNYKGFSIGAQVDYTHGGDMYSTTTAATISRGLSKDTDFDRSQTIILEGVLQNGQPNNIQINATQFGFEMNGFFIDEEAVHDATTIRLREISLSYDVPKKILEKTPFGSLSFSLIGQNLWYKAVNFPKYVNFDPEMSSLGVGNGKGFDYLTGPTTKKYGFNMKLTF